MQFATLRFTSDVAANHQRPGYFDTTYDLPDGATTLGRADENDIVLSGDLVSRKHARMFVRGDDLVMEDLGSRNGTRVNNEAMAGKRALRPGDTVAIGKNQLGIGSRPPSRTPAPRWSTPGRAG